MMRRDETDTRTILRKAFDEMEDDTSYEWSEKSDDLSWAEQQKRIVNYIDAVGGFDWTRLKTACPLCGSKSGRPHFIAVDGRRKKVCSPCNRCLELLDTFFIDICTPCERVDFHHKNKISLALANKFLKHKSRGGRKYNVMLNDCQKCFLKSDLGKKLEIYISGRMY